MAFPLQRLPHLVLVQVFKAMSVENIICLAQISRKMRKIIRNLSKKKITLSYTDFGGVDSGCISLKRFPLNDSLKDESAEFPGWTTWKFGDIVVNAKTTMENRSCQSLLLWRKQTEGFKGIVNFLMDIFKIEFISFPIDAREHYDEQCELIDFIVDKNVRIDNITWQLFECPEFEFYETLRRVINAENCLVLNFMCANLENWKFEGFKEHKMKSFALDGAKWITVENLCELINCSEVTLSSVKLTSRDLNQFLKYWLENDGKVTKWRIYRWEVFDSIIVLDGLPTERNEENGSWRITKPSGEVFKVQLKRGELSLTKE